MKRLFYGVAVSALVLGAGGAAVACDQHAHSAALKNPAAAKQAATMRGILLAQSQSDEQKSTTTGDEEKKDKDQALPSKAIGPLAQSQDDADKEKMDEEKKPEATPGRAGNMVLAQAQSDEQSGTTGEGSSDEQKSGDEQKDE